MNKSVSINIAKLAVVTLFVIAFVGCHTSKNAVTTEGKLTKKSHDEVISSALNQELKYTTISGKMDLELLPTNSKKKMKSGSFVKLIHDSIFQISIRPLLGFEAMRITVTPDSVYIVDRINKKYATENISKLHESGGIQFNYYNLQALLTNALFLPGEKFIEKNDFKQFDVTTASNMYLAKTKDKSGILYNFAIDASDRVASALIYSPERNYTLQWSYNNFIKDGDYVYPTKMVANIDIKKKRLDANMSYSKLDINKEVIIDNSTPNKYEKVSVSDIIKAYMK